MGTRFVLVRLAGSRDLAHAAFEHVGRETQMREELKEAVRDLVSHPPGREHSISDQAVRDRLVALGSYVARARSPVDRDQQGEIRLVLDPEAPTRVVKMFAQLWRASGLLGLDVEAAWQLVRRVGLDSIPKLRRVILDYLATSITPRSTTDIAEAVEHPSRTTRRALEDLTAHRVIHRLPEGQVKADRWALTDQTADWLAVTLPVSSVPVQSAPPLKEFEITNDDKTGKVPTSARDTAWAESDAAFNRGWKA
jgi:hypothetical protein